jgi:hypothetical protein
MRNIFRFFLSLVTVIVLFGCSDRLDDYYTAEDLAGLKVHIQLPDYSRALVKTRALDAGESISSVTVIAYNSDGGFISQQTVKPDDNGVIKPSLPSGTASVAVVANYDHTFTEEETKSLASTLVSSTPDASKPICWGTASVNDLLTSSSPEISLLRMTAKVTVENKADGFTLKGFKMCNTADKGTIAPADGKGDAYTTLVKETRNFTTTTGDYSATSPLVFYETPSSVGSYLIVKGTYDNNDYYYKVMMYKDQKIIDLLRNHNYIVTINSVNAKGYSTPELAAANEAENRMSVTVIDDNPPIVDIISCKDYELGVCDTLNFLGTGDAIDENGNTKDKDGKPVTLNITVATSYKSNNAYTYNISTTDSWIKVDDSKAEMTTFASNGSNGSAGPELNRGAKFVIPVTLNAANPSENSREGTVTVTAGDLTRTIIIKQAGYDFLVDPERPVQFFIDNTQKSNNYFGAFLPAVQGVSAADNQGLERDHGLHFAAVNGNTYSYKVPHLDGDQLTNNDASHISITDGGVGNYYTVTLKDKTSDDLWVSSFTIKNKAGVTITYPVYHTGVFHQITETNANTWQLGPQEKKKTGWFYYGVVEVKGTSGTYRMLDRNIGATSNGFYSPATQATKKYKGAVGAYIMLTKDKLAKTTSESTLGKDYMPFPDYFHIPEGDKSGADGVDEITDLPITIEPKTTSAGETYYCYVIPTTGKHDDGVQPAQVYLPVTGYYEGTAFRNDNHVNIWSRSRLSAYQGFSADSPEYGLWFLYLDINGQKRTKSNIRIVNGSAGRIGINGNGVDAIYNALPVRGIHKK